MRQPLYIPWLKKRPRLKQEYECAIITLIPYALQVAFIRQEDIQ